MGTGNGSIIKFDKAKKNMAILWLIFAAMIFTIFIIMTFTKFQNYDQTAWNWLLPSLLPTLSLIIGVLVTDSSSKTDLDVTVGRFYYIIAMGCSVFYLTLLLGLILLHSEMSIDIETMFKRSNIFLGPLQGLVSASIGIFYYKSN